MFNVSDDAWNETMTVNLLSPPTNRTRIYYPAMVEASRCRVTTISSGAAVNSLVVMVSILHAARLLLICGPDVLLMKVGMTM